MKPVHWRKLSCGKSSRYTVSRDARISRPSSLVWPAIRQNGCSLSKRRWTQPSTTPSPSLAEGVFTVTHPFHPLYGQQFEILTYRHNWGEYRVTFYQTPDHVRALPAAWTSLAPPDPSVMLAAGRAAFRMADLLQLSRLIERIEEGHKEEAEC